MEIVELAEHLAHRDPVKSEIDGITIDVGDVSVNFSAVQSPATSVDGQISFGGVVDGYPLLTGLDPNDDGRFTMRELRGLSERLAKFDRNKDGMLSEAESLSPIRICIGLGATAHKELINVRSLRDKAKAEPVVGPEWFVRMDRNDDNDLSRKEFPGTDEQYEQLDADGDKLISAAEANEFDKQQSDNAG